MILQSFENPVWTITEVGAIYPLLATVVVFLGYNLIDSLREIILDIKKALRK